MSHVFKCVVFGLLMAASSAHAFFGLFEPNVDAVKERLKDPYSAQFHEVKDMGAGVTCGQVNSKNSMGAYTGRQNFAIRRGAAYLEQEAPDQYKFYCVTFAQCVANKIRPSADDCMNYVFAQQETTRKDPRNSRLRSRGQTACDNWYSYKGKPSNGYPKVADCKVSVNRCVDNYAQKGYERVAQCLMAIPMVASQESNIAYGLD